MTDVAVEWPFLVYHDPDEFGPKDGWRHVPVGEAERRGARPCTRCFSPEFRASRDCGRGLSGLDAVLDGLDGEPVETFRVDADEVSINLEGLRQ